jgi:hypothetical protein
MDQWQDTEAALTQLYRHAEGRAIEPSTGTSRTSGASASGRAACACPSSSWSPPAASSPCSTPPPRPRPQPHRLGLRPARPGRRLEQLQDDWAAEGARGASRTVDPKQVQNRLALLRVFSDDVAAQMQQETAEWVLEFQSNLLRLENGTGGGSWSGARVRPVPGRDPDGSRSPAGNGPPSQPATPLGR